MQRNNNRKRQPQAYNFNQGDVYGTMRQDFEVDTDINEDANREQLLDESLDHFLDSMNK